MFVAKLNGGCITLRPDHPAGTTRLMFVAELNGGCIVKAGLTGLLNSGVTTVFSLFCQRCYQELASSVKSETVLGSVTVPDHRVDQLSEITGTDKSVYAEIEFADVPASIDHGALAPAMINSLRSMDAIVLVIRAFENPAVPHPSTEVDPVRDIEFFLHEALLSDLIQTENKLERIVKEGRIKSREGQFFSEIKNQLDQSVPVRDMQLGADALKEISGFSFLTQKPWLVIINCDPGSEPSDAILDTMNKYQLPGIYVPGLFELELEELPESDREEFLLDSGYTKSGRARFINLIYSEFDLISFLTFGKDECRAWSVKRGSTALDAAHKIHSDIARGFIRAEVISYKDFVEYNGSIPALRKSGKLRVEGKNYMIQDGDVVTILFNI